MITDRFLGLGGGQSGGRDVGSLPQKDLECGRIKVLHCKISPRCLKGHENSNILVGQDSFHANTCSMQERKSGLHERMVSIIRVGLPDSSVPRPYCGCFSIFRSNIKYLNETGSCRDLSIEVFLPLLLLHLQGKA